MIERGDNSISMGMDMANVLGEDNEQRLKEFSYIQQTFEQLPSWWDDPNRSFGGWLKDTGGALISDPVNFVGVGVGGQAAKQAYKVALKEALKGKLASEISELSIREAAKQAQQKALGKAVVKGGLYEGGISGTITGAQDAMLQTTAIQTGVQDEFSLAQSGISSAAGFGFGTAFGSVFSYGAFKLTSRTLQKDSVKQLIDLQNFGRSDITGKQLFKVIGVISIYHTSKHWCIITMFYSLIVVKIIHGLFFVYVTKSSSYWIKNRILTRINTLTGSPHNIWIANYFKVSWATHFI